MVPGPGSEGPWALRSKHLAGNSELLGSKLNAIYEGLASCCGVSEAAPTMQTLELQGEHEFGKVASIIHERCESSRRLKIVRHGYTGHRRSIYLRLEVAIRLRLAVSNREADATTVG